MILCRRIGAFSIACLGMTGAVFGIYFWPSELQQDLLGSDSWICGIGTVLSILGIFLNGFMMYGVLMNKSGFVLLWLLVNWIVLLLLIPIFFIGFIWMGINWDFKRHSEGKIFIIAANLVWILCYYMTTLVQTVYNDIVGSDPWVKLDSMTGENEHCEGYNDIVGSDPWVKFYSRTGENENCEGYMKLNKRNLELNKFRLPNFAQDIERGH
jgi:hypothetical protein